MKVYVPSNFISLCSVLLLYIQIAILDPGCHLNSNSVIATDYIIIYYTVYLIIVIKIPVKIFLWEMTNSTWMLTHELKGIQFFDFEFCSTLLLIRTHIQIFVHSWLPKVPPLVQKVSRLTFLINRFGNFNYIANQCIKSSI